MPKLVSIVFAESKSVDVNTNNVSLFNIVDKINARLPEVLKGKQAIIPFKSVLYSRWVEGGGANRYKIKSFIESPSKAMSTDLESDVIFEGNESAVNIIQSDSLYIQGAGRYSIVLQILEDNNWIEVARYPFTVEITYQASN